MLRRCLIVVVALWTSAVPAAETPPLAQAIAAGDVTAVEAALAEGAGVGTPFPDGLTTPLGLAVALGDTTIAALLLDRGADIDQPGLLGMPPIALAAQSCRSGPGMVGLLVSRGADIDARAPGAQTALLIATMKGRDAIATALIAAGADAAAVDVFGDGILNYAIYAEAPDQVRRALNAGSGTAQLDRLFLTRSYRATVWPGTPLCPGEG
jgi:ankyrin repeat protein